jgi:hypothetical protein
MPDVSERVYIKKRTLYARYGITVWLTSGNINTLISSVLVIIRITIASWSSTVAWRSAFLLMERGNIDLCQVNTMVSWKILQARNLLSGVYGVAVAGILWTPVEKSNQKAKNMYALFVASILILMWPATWGAPLLISAVEWLPKEITVREELLHDTYEPEYDISRYSRMQYLITPDSHFKGLRELALI